MVVSYFVGISSFREKNEGKEESVEREKYCSFLSAHFLGLSLAIAAFLADY
jgi:hypothetical protein